MKSVIAKEECSLMLCTGNIMKIPERRIKYHVWYTYWRLDHILSIMSMTMIPLTVYRISLFFYVACAFWFPNTLMDLCVSVWVSSTFCIFHVKHHINVCNTHLSNEKSEWSRVREKERERVIEKGEREHENPQRINVNCIYLCICFSPICLMPRANVRLTILRMLFL